MSASTALTESSGLHGYPYPDTPNPDLLDRIPLTAGVILDVGCGTGALGAAYKRLNPSCIYYGIETHVGAARLAAERLDGVAAIDVEKNDVPFLLDSRVDCLIYGDVIEHLYDPWSLIKSHTNLLSPSGVVLICVPNGEHWSMVARLLFSQFNYEESGLLDKQHIRFFTLQSMQAMLKLADLQTVDIKPRIFDSKKSEKFYTAIAPTLSAMKIDADAYVARSQPMQYVWRATKAPVDRLTILGTMLEPVGGVSQVRVVDPLHGLATIPGITTGIFDMSDPPRFTDVGPLILILHRPALVEEGGLATLRSLANLGSRNPNCIVVTEFDDHPSYIPILKDRIVWNFRGVHAVQTTTEPLAEVLRAHNAEVAVFPNAIRRLAPVRNFEQDRYLTILFAGINRENDWPPLVQSINAVCREVGERLRFIVIHDRGFYNALDTEYKSFIPMCDYTTYQELLETCELSFMPLANTEFNKCKSDLKFIEAASARVVSLASKTVYANSIEDGVTGLVFSDSHSLEERLRYAIKNPTVLRVIGDAAREYAKSRMLSKQIDARVKWYRSLWQRRADLNAELERRVAAA